jgi:hypothetical protein
MGARGPHREKGIKTAKKSKLEFTGICFFETSWNEDTKSKRTATEDTPFVLNLGGSVGRIGINS